HYVPLEFTNKVNLAGQAFRTAPAANSHPTDIVLNYTVRPDHLQSAVFKMGVAPHTDLSQPFQDTFGVFDTAAGVPVFLLGGPVGKTQFVFADGKTLQGGAMIGGGTDAAGHNYDLLNLRAYTRDTIVNLNNVTEIVRGK